MAVSIIPKSGSVIYASEILENAEGQEEQIQTGQEIVEAYAEGQTEETETLKEQETDVSEKVEENNTVEAAEEIKPKEDQDGKTETPGNPEEEMEILENAEEEKEELREGWEEDSDKSKEKLLKKRRKKS